MCRITLCEKVTYLSQKNNITDRAHNNMLVVNISILVNNLHLLMSNRPKRERSFIYSDEC